MRRVARLRSLPLRGKVFVTLLGAVVAVLGASTYLSFRYWQNEALAASEHQALLAAASTQATIESALRLGRLEPARHSLALLQADGAVTGARVYGEGGNILLSSDRYEEGPRAPSVWIPPAQQLPRGGLVKTDDREGSVRVFLPLSIPEPAVLEVEFSVAAARAAMQRGARLGIGLMAVSLMVVAVAVVTMFEREVVAPMHHMHVMLREARERADDTHRRLEAREGLAEVGELAAEMAHEFKRPLASIRTAVDVLQAEYSLDDGGKRVLGAVEAQLEHLQETMQDLFALAKPVVLETEDVSISDIIDEAVLELAAMPGRERVELRRDRAHETLAVPGDARRLRQAIVNVLANAAEAMPEGGVITLSAEKGPGEVVEISISDTGPGLDPAQVEAALKPFYSTKPLGTGLGLPLVARIVSAHGGGLELKSRPGRGTTVLITLPLTRKPVAGVA
jgi:signal transduction histidine kinase